MKKDLEMKVCSKCQKEKKTSEFDKYRHKCRECRAEEKINYNIKNTERGLEFLKEYLGGEFYCKKCGVTSEWEHKFFEWHHRDPKTKKFNVSSRLASGSLDIIKEEADKCDCLCPTCHKLIHLETWGVATRWDKH